mmetsp:Transcript_1186/g.2076  ORF Transcript_1186/g.2076 Transcript_1186/m.2076 type:complete len:213 (-) Transcript_1186:1002-1640(-)
MRRTSSKTRPSLWRCWGGTMATTARPRRRFCSSWALCVPPRPAMPQCRTPESTAAGACDSRPKASSTSATRWAAAWTAQSRGWRGSSAAARPRRPPPRPFRGRSPPPPTNRTAASESTRILNWSPPTRALTNSCSSATAPSPSSGSRPLQQKLCPSVWTSPSTWPILMCSGSGCLTLSHSACWAKRPWDGWIPTTCRTTCVSLKAIRGPPLC